MKENHISVRKTARYYTLGELNEQTKQVWFVLHGHGHNAKDFLAAFKGYNSAARFFVAPEALNRYYTKGYTGNVGATWMTKEDRLNEISDYINYLEDLYASLGLDKFKGTVTALGFSQGGSTLTRWVNSSAKRFTNMVVYAGEVAPELLPLQPGSSLRKTKNYFICGTQDEFFPPQRLAEAKANYAELNFTEISFEGGHELKLETLAHLL